MISWTIDVSRFRALANQYRDEVAQILETENQRGALTGAQMMARIIPVESGELKDTIRVTKEGQAWVLAVGDASTEKTWRTASGASAKFNLARLIEWGTTKNEEDPFVTPMRRRMRRLHRNRIRRRINALAASLFGR